MLKEFLILVVLLTLFIPTVSALSLGGRQLSPIIYAPGKIITNHYVIGDTEKNVEINVGGDFMEYISISDVVNNQFDMTIAFPNHLVPAGEYGFALTVKELGGGPGGFSSFVNVEKRFNVEVYSDVKEIGASLSAGSVNAGTPVQFKVGINSMGYQDIDAVTAQITVIGPDNEVIGVVTTNTVSLDALESKTLRATFDTFGLIHGKYKARANVFYDGNKKEASTSFRIGEMDLQLLNYTQKLPQGFSNFKVNLFNNWGNELRFVYIKLLIDNQEYLHTPSISIEPWGQKTIEGIVNIELEKGEYGGVLELFFEGERKIEPITISVMAASAETVVKEEKKYLMTVVIATVTLSILLLIILIVIILKHKREEDEI